MHSFCFHNYTVLMPLLMMVLLVGWQTTLLTRHRLVEIFGKPYICLFATHRILTGEELLYNYNDRRKNVTNSLQWLKK